MNIKINGKTETLPEQVMNLQELVVNRGLAPERVIIEVNLEIIPRSRWPNTNLQEKDAVEIISFVGGG